MPEHWVSALFRKFQCIYTHRWTSAIDGIEQTAIREWSKGLAGITGQQIRVGLDACPADWPPTLPEFRQACLGATHDPHNTRAYQRFAPALPTPPAAAETVSRELGHMRARPNMSREEMEAELARLRRAGL